MTAIPVGRGGSGWFFKLVLLFLVGFSLLYIGRSVMTGVIYGAHATAKHQADAMSVRRCLDSYGPEMVFKHKTDAIWYLLCRLDDGRWGLQPVAKDGREKTAFIPKDGSFREVMKYLDKFATKFTGRLPWK